MVFYQGFEGGRNKRLAKPLPGARGSEFKRPPVTTMSFNVLVSTLLKTDSSIRTYLHVISYGHRHMNYDKKSTPAFKWGADVLRRGLGCFK